MIFLTLRQNDPRPTAKRTTHPKKKVKKIASHYNGKHCFAEIGFDYYWQSISKQNRRIKVSTWCLVSAKENQHFPL